MKFTVIDNKTGKYPDIEKIIKTEWWAYELFYSGDGIFAIDEDCTLMLLDDCDNVAYPPDGRFKIVWSEDDGKVS